jgi:hypothetical protein
MALRSRLADVAWNALLNLWIRRGAAPAAVPGPRPRDAGRRTRNQGAEMKIQKLDLDALAVESFVTGESEGVAVVFGPTQRCETRLTNCTIGP